MEGFNQERRGLFDGLRVPHSLPGLVIAFGALGAFLLLVVGIEELCHIRGERPLRLLLGMLGNATSVLGYPGSVVARLGGWTNEWTPYGALAWVLFLLSFALVWSFASTAVQRVVAHRIAREEGLSLGEALRFGKKKFAPTFLSVALVGLLVLFFRVLVNATLAGEAADWLGGVGNFLLGPLFVVVLLSTAFSVFLTVLGLFGFNLASAVIATEDADTFEGLSRAWNYLLARPWQVLVAFLAQGLYLALVMWAGTWFLHASVRSLSIGEWGLGTGLQRVELDDDMRAALGERLPKDSKLDVAYLPGKGAWLESFVFGVAALDQKGRLDAAQGVELALERYRADVGDYPSEVEGLRALVEDPHGWLPTEQRRPELDRWHGPYLHGGLPTLKDQVVQYVRTDVSPPSVYDLRLAGPDGLLKTADDEKGLQGVGAGKSAHLLDVAPLQGWTLSWAGWWVWFWVRLAQLGMIAYSIYYLLAAQCTTYFLLRRDLEGDEYSEITLEEDEEDAETSYDHGQVWRPEGATPTTPMARGGEGKPLPTIEPPKDKPTS